jgi:hypothetical protein
MNVPPLYPQQLNPFDAHSPPSNHPTGQFFGDGQNSAEMHHHQQQQESETFDGSEDTPANAGGFFPNHFRLKTTVSYKVQQ